MNYDELLLNTTTKRPQEKEIETPACPVHWSDKYVGLPLQARTLEDKDGKDYFVQSSTVCFDCASFVKHVIQKEWRSDFQWPFEHIEQFGALFKQHNVQEKSGKLKKPEDKAIALLNIAGKPQHVGLVCDFTVDNYIPPGFFILHAWQPAGQVVRMPLKRLQRFGLEVEGCYSWQNKPSDK